MGEEKQVGWDTRRKPDYFRLMRYCKNLTQLSALMQLIVADHGIAPSAWDEHNCISLANELEENMGGNGNSEDYPSLIDREGLIRLLRAAGELYWELPEW
jgi:hypothetical protein